MRIGAISSLIILDIIVIGVIALFAFNGYKRGGIKAFMSLSLLCIVVLASMLLYQRPAIFLQVTLDISSSLIRIICFSIIFTILYVVSRFVYFVLSRLTSSMAVRGIFSGTIGALFGMVEAIVLISLIFMNIAFYPVKPPLSDSLSFMIMKDIPMNMREKGLWFLPEEDLDRYEELLRNRKRSADPILGT